MHSLSRGQCGAREDAERRRVNTRTKWPRRTCALDVESHSCREMARREPDAARADVWVTSRFQGGFQRYSGLCGGEPRKVAEERCVWGTAANSSCCCSNTSAASVSREWEHAMGCGSTAELATVTRRGTRSSARCAVRHRTGERKQSRAAGAFSSTPRCARCAGWGAQIDMRHFLPGKSAQGKIGISSRVISAGPNSGRRFSSCGWRRCFMRVGWTTPPHVG